MPSKKDLKVCSYICGNTWLGLKFNKGVKSLVEIWVKIAARLIITRDS